VRVPRENPDALPTLTFPAAAVPTGSWLKINSDGETTVTLAIPGSHLAEAVKLNLYKDRAFTVEIRP
jgi:hypothetical protein